MMITEMIADGESAVLLDTIVEYKYKRRNEKCLDMSAQDIICSDIYPK